jgi:radical SAM protein with 4Fe4S-binding SPASM domain
MEVGSSCNLDCIHPLCPVGIRDQGERILYDDKIVDLAVTAYGMGFEGYVGFHYYNEPLLHPLRLTYLIDTIRVSVPHSRFILWTNGTYINESNKELVNKFDMRIVSDYFNHGEAHFRKFIPEGHLMVNPENFDGRLEYGDVETVQPCLRPFIEFNIDAFGEVHICCQDWRGKIKIGNVYDLTLQELDNKRTEIIKTIVKPMTTDSPEVCRKCKGKMGLPDFVPEIAAKAFAVIEPLRQA